MATSEQISSEQKFSQGVSKTPATYTKELKHIKSSIRHRNVCATLNNYTELEFQCAQHFLVNCCSYGVIAKEVGEVEKTPHLQCYFEFSSQKTQLSMVKNLGEDVSIGQPIRWFFSERKGSALDASNYCKKGEQPKEQWKDQKHLGKNWGDNAIFVEHGEISKQGERTDWARAVGEISNNVSISEVIVAQPQLLPSIRALERFQQMVLKPKNRPNIKVYVRYGRAGVGKSHFAHQFDDVYSKPAGQWWDGYTGQKVVLLDDFSGSFMAHNELLRVLDVWAINLPYKGGYVQAQYETVIITSNNPPWKWYQMGLRPQLARRLHDVRYCVSRDNHELIDLTSYIISDEVIDEAI